MKKNYRCIGLLLSPPLMNKNSALSQRRKQLQALVISLSILGTPLTRAASLPSIVMTFKEDLITVWIQGSRHKWD